MANSYEMARLKVKLDHCYEELSYEVENQNSEACYDQLGRIIALEKEILKLKLSEVKGNE